MHNVRFPVQVMQPNFKVRRDLILGNRGSEARRGRLLTDRLRHHPHPVSADQVETQGKEKEHTSRFDKDEKGPLKLKDLA